MICCDTAATPMPLSAMRRYASRYAGQYSSRAGELDQSSRPKYVTGPAQPKSPKPATSGLVVSTAGRVSHPAAARRKRRRVRGIAPRDRLEADRVAAPHPEG